MADLERRLTFFAYSDFVVEKPFDRMALEERFADLDDDAKRPLQRDSFSFDVLLEDAGSETAPTRFKILRLRDYDNRPYVFSRPQRSMAPVDIQTDESIVDVAHVVMWPDGYAAIDQGGHAPPLSALQNFLWARCVEGVQFDPLYDRQVVERLKAISKRVRRVEIGVENSSATQQALDQKLTPLKGLLGLLRGNEGVTFKSEIKVSRRGRGARSRVLPEEVSEQLLLDVEEAQALLDTYKVSGLTKDGKRDTVDLISERLHVPAKLPRASAGGHMPDSAATYRAILQARRTLDGRNALRDAARSVVNTNSS